MRLFVAITDSDWFSYLSQGKPPEEVNFWQPSGYREFHALQPGEPFLFKLHSPRDYIVGGGFFVRFLRYPVSYVWKAFGTNNGASSEQEMRSRLERYRKAKPGEDYEVGCIILQSPFFFPQSDWIPLPDWKKPIVVGKTYESVEEPGKSLWASVSTRIRGKEVEAVITPAVDEPKARFGQPLIVQPRLGQGTFRMVVADTYRRRCAVTGTPVLPVLEAAHIRPYHLDGPHLIQNGILLRQDLHTLLDRGYITVTPDFRVNVSRHVKEDFENGKEYYALHGGLISLPPQRELRPALEYLTWHNEKKYRG